MGRRKHWDHGMASRAGSPGGMLQKSYDVLFGPLKHNRSAEIEKRVQAGLQNTRAMQGRR